MPFVRLDVVSTDRRVLYQTVRLCMAGEERLGLGQGPESVFDPAVLEPERNGQWTGREVHIMAQLN